MKRAHCTNLDAPIRPAAGCGIMAAMLERCEGVGALACCFDVALRPVRVSEGRPALAAWLKNPELTNRIAAVLAGTMGGPPPPEPVQVFPGCWMFALAHREGSMPAGFTVALMLGPEALVEPVFMQGCRTVNVDPLAAGAEAVQIARFNGPSAAIAARALKAMAGDLETIEEQKTALEGFTAQLSDSYDTMDLLYSVGRSMRALSEPEQFLSFVCRRLQGTMSFRWVAMAFGTGDGVSAGLRERAFMAGELPCPASAFRNHCDPLIQADGPGLPQVLERVAGLSSAEAPQVLVQPVVCKGRTVGVIAAGGKHGADPDVSSYDIQLVESTGGYLNAFVENVGLYEDQHELFMGTVQALTAAIDAKDRYTYGHSERVALMASRLAAASGMSPAESERVRIAGLVHDVGKIGVPEAVLCKQGRLTREEFDIVRRHPEIGHTILRDITLLDDVLPGVLHHHERFDGKGYPRGLAGNDIPLVARILAVADTFDAMSSNRSYRAAMPRADVLAEIERCAGTQFDPELARTFLTLDLAEYDRAVARHAAGQVGLAA